MQFNCTETYILEDNAVCLRPLELTDFEHLIRFSLAEPEIWKFSLINAAGEKELARYIEQAVYGRKSGKEYPFIVYDKYIQQYAGSTRFYDINLPNKTLKLGYTWYGKAFQGTGLNKRCKWLLLQFAFEKMEMERVEFRADYDNKRSIAAMESIGCKVEGVLRSNELKPDGSRRDSMVMSILKREWENGIKESLKNKLMR